MSFARPACMTILFLLIVFILSPSLAMDLRVGTYNGSRSNAEVGFIFQTWLSHHGKSYVDALGEKQQRFEIFKDNLRFIDQHNAKNLSYQLGLTRFADLTVQEYRDRFSGRPDHEPIHRARRVSHRYVSLAEDQLPESIDWRNEGAVTHYYMVDFSITLKLSILLNRQTSTVFEMENTNYSRHQVFISFRGKDERKKFLPLLKDHLKMSKVNVFTDEDALSVPLDSPSAYLTIG